jgi:hypothetical protein
MHALRQSDSRIADLQARAPRFNSSKTIMVEEPIRITRTIYNYKITNIRKASIIHSVKRIA